MRILAIVLLTIAALVAGLAVWTALAFGREYGADTFWLTLGWGFAFALVAAVSGIFLSQTLVQNEPPHFTQVGHKAGTEGEGAWV